jgi:hypothetical protein
MYIRGGNMNKQHRHKGEVVSALNCVIKHPAMKAYGGVEV